MKKLCALLLCCMVISVQAQTLQFDQLDYYLHQALNAESATQRYALNHIGIQGKAEADGFLVTAVLESYPAQRAGLYRGDVIRSADGTAFHPLFSFNERDLAPNRFRANPRSVQLTIARGASELQLSVQPVFENLYDSFRSASLNSVQQFPSGNKTVGYLRLWLLSRNSNDLISYRRLFSELEGTDGLILDLRDSVGFLDREQLRLVYRGDSNLVPGTSALLDEIINSPVTTPADGYRNPIALLINSQTRGGAELFARQLDQLNRVITLGEQTAGQIGSWITTDDTDTMHYSSESILELPDSIEGLGHPPENLQSYPATQPGRVDPQFQAAMDMLMGII